jgi:hypothetical protein
VATQGTVRRVTHVGSNSCPAKSSSAHVPRPADLRATPRRRPPLRLLLRGHENGPQDDVLRAVLPSSGGRIRTYDLWVMRRSVRHSPVSAWLSSYRSCDVSIPTAALDRLASIRGVSPVRTRPRHRRDHGRDHNCIELGRPAVRICRGPPSDTVTGVSLLLSQLFSQVRPTRTT